MARPPGWSVTAQTVVQRERWAGKYRDGVKTKSIALVSAGQEVIPDQPVARLEWKISSELGSFAAATHTLYNLDSVQRSEIVPSGLYGRVISITPRGGVVIESRAALIRGAIGAGNQVAGILNIWRPGVGVSGQPSRQQAIPTGAILVVPGPLTFALLRQAVNSGVVGIIASSIASRDFEGFLHADLIQLLNTVDVEQVQAYLPTMTILLTEGLGSFPMSSQAVTVISQYQGRIALLSGLTSLQQGLFPELVISLSPQQTQQQWHPVLPDLALTLGAQVRISSGEYEGVAGTIDYIFAYKQTFASGMRAYAVRIRLDNGSTIIVPTALAKRIG